MKVNLVDPMPLHPLLCYPGTSRPLKAVAVRNGLPVWPLLGGDGEGDDTGDGEDADADEEDPNEDADDEGDEDADDSGKQKGKKRTGPVSREEFERIQRHLSNSDRRRSEAEKKAAALQKEKDDAERKNKPELENLRKDHGELTKAHESLQSRFTSLALTNAFLIASQQENIAWHNPKVAQAAADDLKDLEIDENGNVEGIREVVKALAKKHKYLVNAGKEERDEDKDDKPPARRGASGSGVGSVKTAKGKKPNNGQLTTEELRQRFPALNKHR